MNDFSPLWTLLIWKERVYASHLWMILSPLWILSIWKERVCTNCFYSWSPLLVIRLFTFSPWAFGSEPFAWNFSSAVKSTIKFLKIIINSQNIIKIFIPSHRLMRTAFLKTDHLCVIFWLWQWYDGLEFFRKWTNVGKHVLKTKGV